MRFDVRVPGTVVAGHGVASGRAPGCPYPEGTLGLQLPIFRRLGLDLYRCHPGTINVSTAPARVRFARPAHRFTAVRWTDLHPPEDFAFVRCRIGHGGRAYEGWGYRPDPATKVEHFQDPVVVEVIAPFLEGLAPGSEVLLELMSGEVEVEGA